MSTDRTLVQIRERSFLDLLDLSLFVVRRKPLALAASAAAGILPFELFNAWFVGEVEAPGAWLGMIVLEQGLATAPLTVVLGGMMFGQRPSAAKVGATIGRGAFSLLLYQGLIRSFLLMVFFLSWVVPTQLAFVNEVVLLERCPITRVITRSSRLAQGRGMELIGRSLVAVGFTILWVAAFWWGSDQLVKLLFREWSWEAPTGLDGSPGWGPRLGMWLAMAFWGVVRFMTYIDQRIRLEGWEISLKLRAAGASLEEDERW